MRTHPRFPDHIAVNHHTLPSADDRVAITNDRAWSHGVCVECPERVCSLSEDDMVYGRCLLASADPAVSSGVWMTLTTYAAFKLHNGETRALE